MRQRASVLGFEALITLEAGRHLRLVLAEEGDRRGDPGRAAEGPAAVEDLRARLVKSDRVVPARRAAVLLVLVVVVMNWVRNTVNRMLAIGESRVERSS